MPTALVRSLLALLLLLAGVTPALAQTTVTLRDGLNGYAGTRDVDPLSLLSIACPRCADWTLQRRRRARGAGLQLFTGHRSPVLPAPPTIWSRRASAHIRQ